MNPTSEQLEVIEAIKDYNVSVDTVVGSGKTTMILFMAQRYPDLNILSLTYNRRLRQETKVRYDQMTTNNNLDIHTFHSFYVKHYNRNCYTDHELLKFLENERTNTNTITSMMKNEMYDLIIVDEAQDMNELYYRAVLKIIKDHVKSDAKMCIIGDCNQSIYVYNGANTKYLREPERHFMANRNSWKCLKLSMTFRCTRVMTSFIRECLGGPLIIPYKKGECPKINYVICNTFGNDPLKELLYFIEQVPIKEILVLAPSLRNQNSPVNSLVNKISEKGYHVFCPTSDDEQIDDELTQGKLVFCTYHQSKGLERTAVMIFGFDLSYNIYFNKKNVESLSNEMFVALTRSKKYLTLIHDKKNDYLKFVNRYTLSNYCNMKGVGVKKPKRITQTTRSEFSVSDLTRHVSSKDLYELISLLTIEMINAPEVKIDIPNKVPQYSQNMCIYENVSDINGIAIPAYFEYLTTGIFTIENVLLDKKIINSKIRGDPKIEDILLLGNTWVAYQNGYKHRLNQIGQYTWLTKIVLDQCINRLKCVIPEDNLIFETPVARTYNDVVITGYIDIVCKDKFFEIKCVEKLTEASYLQTILYRFLTGSTYAAYLFNIRDNSLFKVSVGEEGMNQILSTLIKKKQNMGNEELDEDDDVEGMQGTQV